MIRTRFAPSPTGYLHIGGARTALFSWAFARNHGGTFILRVEDTDTERSTGESVDAILESMQWLKLDYDEGPYFQSQRFARYREVAHALLAAGKAYHCYCTKEELEAMREEQRVQGLKPRYDGRWRDSSEKPPEGIPPVIRFKNPLEGEVVFNDLVKGEIIVANSELDDLVIVRADGTPTYNFGVVVDDLDMNITHVIRGDDHINNTPRQINILQALDAALPQYGHVPMILGEDGERLSKRHGAVSVTQYRDEGYLPEALLNYLARLGWAHGDDEIFNREQFVEWFDLSAVSKSPAKFDPEKLVWLNQQYLKAGDDARLARLAAPMLRIEPDSRLEAIVGVMKERIGTIAQFADSASYFFRFDPPTLELRTRFYSAQIKPALNRLRDSFAAIPWERKAIHDSIKGTAKEHALKLGQLAMPLRVMVTGVTETPSIDVTLELIGRGEVLARMDGELEKFPD
ncbi:MAG: glutamate--tRNA ligase [Burkholderiales bacterium]